MTAHSRYTLFADDLEHVLRHTQGLWDEVRGQRLFITGGTGFFGIWLLESFLWINEQLGLGAQVHVLSRDPPAFLRRATHLTHQAALVLHAGDVRHFDFPAPPFAHVIHAATPFGVQLDRENPLLLLDTIMEGTRHVLDFAACCGARNLLLTSSGAIYGRQPAELACITEDFAGAPDPLDPGSAYAQGKRLAEHLCALYAGRHQLECKIARCFTFVGPYLPLDAHLAIGNFIRDGLSGNAIHVNGDGSPFRSYLYAADLTIWLWTILLRGRSCVPYNVGSAVAVRIAELAELVAARFEPKREVRIHGQPAPSTPAERYIPSTDRATNELGLRLRVELRDAVQRTATWYSQRT